MERVVVFVDAQNFYHSARRAFCQDGAPALEGQFRPRALAEMLVRRRPGRVLHQVRVYRGRPDPHREPKAHAANTRQCEAWARDGVIVNCRTLRYPGDWPRQRAEEKGIDVWLATDLVKMALREQMDVAMIASGDSDLAPAVDEAVEAGVTVEVVGWRGNPYRQRLNVPGRKLWCHWLLDSDYGFLKDPTDYNIS